MNQRISLFAILCFWAIAHGAIAQTSGAPAPAASGYPSKAVKLIVPVTTGGPSDLVARIVADKWRHRGPKDCAKYFLAGVRRRLG
jgi:tripartite-type tricarboxylate transporter receptor subunit TctC